MERLCGISSSPSFSSQRIWNWMLKTGGYRQFLLLRSDYANHLQRLRFDCQNVRCSRRYANHTKIPTFWVLTTSMVKVRSKTKSMRTHRINKLRNKICFVSNTLCLLLHSVHWCNNIMASHQHWPQPQLHRWFKTKRIDPTHSPHPTSIPVPILQNIESQPINNYKFESLRQNQQCRSYLSSLTPLLLTFARLWTAP